MARTRAREIASFWPSRPQKLVKTNTLNQQCWQNPRRLGLGWPEASWDEVGQVWNGGLVWDGEPGAEIVPERHSELLAGFHQAQERVPAIAAPVAASSAADLAPGDLGADVVLRSVGVQRDLGAVEHSEQFGLVGTQPREQPVQGDETGPTLKDAIKPRPQFGPAAPGWLSPVGLEVAVKPADQRSQVLLCRALMIREGIELVHEALGVHPAQGMQADAELAGIVADNHCPRQQAVRLDRTPEGAL